MPRFFSHLIVFLHRIVAFFTSRSAGLHHARFAHLHELSPLITPSFDETSLLLGTGSFNHLLTVRPTKTRRELGNMLVVAPPRSGKSVLATSQLLSWPHSVIVNDVKGELFTATAGFRSTIGQVFVIDPTGVGHCYDPLLGKHTEDELLSAATHLLYQPEEGEGRIFTQRATVMLTMLFLAARQEGVAPLPYVRGMIRLGLPDVAARLNRLDPELATQLLESRYEAVNHDNKFLVSAWETLTSRMRPLLTETVVRCFAGWDFSAREVMTAGKPLTVYLRFKEPDLLALSPLVRLLWTSLINELITTYDQAAGQGCHPVLLLIDEAGRTAIPSLADHATTVVGRGISLWIAIQDLNQLDAVYGTARAHVLRNSVETHVYYRPIDQTTAEYLERCLGRKSDYAHSETLREGAETSEGRSEQGIPLMTAQDIKQMPDEEVIGYHRHLPPFRLKRLDWRQQALLTKRRNLPAPPLRELPSLAEIHLRNTRAPTYKLVDPDALR
jgi:type IV secretion system protein VirD4